MTTRKVLLSGDVLGKFQTLFKRVAAVNKSNGPFDILLCTGVFTAEAGRWLSPLATSRCVLSSQGDRQSELVSAGTPEEQQALEELKEYISGKKRVPVPTYYVLSNESKDNAILKALNTPDCKADIQCLGTAGIEKVKDLSVAFLGQNFSQVGLLQFLLSITALYQSTRNFYSFLKRKIKSQS